MTYKLYIPANLDLEMLIENSINNYSPKYRQGINPGNLAYILHCIIKRTIQYKEKIYEGSWDGYVKLNANNIRNIISQYSQCMKLLLKQKVIYRKNHSQGNFSCRFCINPKFLEDGYTKVSANKFIIKQLKKRRTKIIKTFPRMAIMDYDRTFLNQFLLSENLTIDVETAKKDIDDNYETIRRNKMTEKEVAKLDEQEFQRILKISKANFKDIVDNLAAKQIETSNDPSGHRYHSPLTNLPSFIRKHLKYNGQKIVSIDVKNSQPYFSTLLFNKEFYEEGEEGIRLSKVYKELYKEINNEETSIKIPFFTNQANEYTDQSTLQYLSDAFEGKIYDRFVNVNEHDSTFSARRNKVKKDFFISIYGNVNHNNPNSKRFYAAYKEPYQVFDTIRQLHVNQNPIEIKLGYPIKEYAKIAILLQRIESYALLDIICKNINEAYPEVPLFTIHDCIATTEQYVDFLYRTMQEELSNLIGKPPTLVIDEWGDNEDPVAMTLAA